MNYKFWFYFRKAIFQGVVPIVTTIITFYDLRNTKSGYISDIYLYTSTILFVYGMLNTLIQFISDIFAIYVGFQEDFNVTDSRMIEEIIVSKQPMTIIKKVFKPKYSNNLFFRGLSKFCWYIGHDCPILIPHSVVNKINNKIMNDPDLIKSCIYGSMDANNILPTITATTSNRNEYRLMNDDMKISNQMNHIKHIIFDDYQ